MILREAHEEAPARVEANLLQEFRKHNAAATRLRMRGRLAALGAAAAVLLTIGVSLRHGAKFHRAPVSQSSPGGGGEVAADRTVPVDAAANLASATATATAFVSLPYATDPATLEEGSVVRVLLSRSALASMGLPVSDAGASERIPADIVLSEDGAPQAIRLVSQTTLDD
jgi:hypothetical protein